MSHPRDTIDLFPIEHSFDDLYVRSTARDRHHRLVAGAERRRLRRRLRA